MDCILLRQEAYVHVLANIRNSNNGKKSSTNSSNSPLAQHVSSLPSPEHLASIDDLNKSKNVNPP